MEVRTMTSGGYQRFSCYGKENPKLTGIFLINAEELLNLLTNLTVGDLDVILRVTIVGHEREESVVRDIELREGLEM